MGDCGKIRLYAAVAAEFLVGVAIATWRALYAALVEGARHAWSALSLESRSAAAAAEALPGAASALFAAASTWLAAARRRFDASEQRSGGPEHSKKGAVLGALVTASCCLLTSCASVDQLEFDREARALVHDGMPASVAVPNLQRAGFVCSPDGAEPPTFDCVRIKVRFVGSCVERVTFVDTVKNGGAIADAKVAAIACAGT